MSHEEAQADLCLYAFGALDRRESRLVAAHLADGCPSCRGELLQWRRVMRLIADAAASPPTDSMNRVPTYRRRRRGLRRWAKPALLAVAAVLSLLGLAREHSWRRDTTRQRRDLSRLDERIQTLERENQRLRQELTDSATDAGWHDPRP